MLAQKRFIQRACLLAAIILLTLTGSGYLSSRAASITAIEDISGPGSVPMYSVYEATFNLSTVYDSAERFDPSKVRVTATFTLPDGNTESVPGFFLQETLPNWAVRYSPRQLGAHKIAITVEDRTGTNTVEGPSFLAEGTLSSGFVTVDSRNKTRLKTSDGNAFVINGTNTPWEQYIGGGETPQAHSISITPIHFAR